MILLLCYHDTHTLTLLLSPHYFHCSTLTPRTLTSNSTLLMVTSLQPCYWQYLPHTPIPPDPPPPSPYLSPGPVCTLCDSEVTDSVYRQSTDCAWIVQMYCVTHSLSISVRQLFGIFSIHPSYYNTKDHKPDITAAQHKKHILHHKLSIFSPTCYFLYNQFINLF